MSILVISVNLDCGCCKAKIEKVLKDLKEEFSIEKIDYEDKNNKVIVRGKFDAQKLCKKIWCQVCYFVKDIKIVDEWPPKPTPPPPKPECKLPPLWPYPLPFPVPSQCWPQQSHCCPKPPLPEPCKCCKCKPSPPPCGCSKHEGCSCGKPPNPPIWPPWCPPTWPPWCPEPVCRPPWCPPTWPPR